MNKSMTRRNFVQAAGLGAGVLAAGGMTARLLAGELSTDAYLKVWEQSQAYTLECAEAMAEENYTFKPNPEIFSFAEQLLHVAGSQYFFMSRIKGEDNPKQRDDFKSEGKSKADVVALLRESFEYGAKVLRSMTTEQFDGEIPFGERKISKKNAFLFCCDHTTHHRGGMVIYLRLKGIKPPQYRCGFLG
jgi:uncharacterized damage-inducible protein DinB